jgi:uncharacterized protein (DUF1501 family)
MDPRRRDLLRASLAAGIAASGGLLASRVSLAAPGAGEQRFVLVLLRGALDGLAAVPPVGDPDYARLRGELNLSDAASLPKLEGPRASSSLQFRPRRECAARPWRTPWQSLSRPLDFDAQDARAAMRGHTPCIGLAQPRAGGHAFVRGAVSQCRRRARANIHW